MKCFTISVSKAVFVTVVTISSVLAAAGERGFDLYKPIIDKNIFGPPPEDPTVIPEKGSARGNDADKTERELTKEQEQLEKSVSVSALVNKPDGTIMVGFSDTSTGKTPVHYYLAVGEEKSGWLVQSVDITNKTVVLEKDGFEIERVLGDKNAASSKDKSDARSGRGRSSLLSMSSDMHRGRGQMSRRARRRFEAEEERKETQQREDRLRKAEAAAALRREQDQAEKEAERAETMEKLQELKNEIDRFREQKGAAQGQNETGGVQ